MSFAYPWLLLFLLLVPPLAWWRFARFNRLPLRFSHEGILRRLPITWAVIAYRFLPAVYALALACLVVAIARPQFAISHHHVRSEGVDIVLVVDVSTSMRAIDLSKQGEELDRLAAAKDVIQRFVKRREADRIGLVAFSGRPYSASPLTYDHDFLLTRLESLKTGMLEDGTAIGDAIAAGVNRLRGSKAKSKVMVLLTDGSHNAGELTPDNAAQAAKALKVKIYTVGAGASGVVLLPMQDPFGNRRYAQTRSDIDDALLTRVAETTGAKYFRAADLATLNKVYDEIDRLERTEIEMNQYSSYEELFVPFVIAALLLLASEMLLSLTRLGRLPA